MTIYAIGDAKYPFSSFWAIASTLLMGGFLDFHVHTLFDLLLGRQAEEDFVEAHPRWPKHKEAPVVLDHRAREIAPDVAAAVAADLVRHDALMRFGDCVIQHPR